MLDDEARSQRGRTWVNAPVGVGKNFMHAQYLYICIQNADYRLELGYTMFKTAPKCGISLENNPNFLGLGHRPSAYPNSLAARSCPTPKMKS